MSRDTAAIFSRRAACALAHLLRFAATRNQGPIARSRATYPAREPEGQGPGILMTTGSPVFGAIRKFVAV